MEYGDWGRFRFMGQRVRVTFAQSWPVPIGNYTYDGFDADGIWVTHAERGQRHILYSDIEKVEVKHDSDEGV